METALTTTSAATPAPTLEQRVIKIQFHLQNIANSAIIIGQELIECKKEVGHGNWGDWLKDNFNLSQESARKFMKIAEHFGANSKSTWNLNPTQMWEMLSLPVGTEEDFIAEKAKVEFNSFSQQAGKYQNAIFRFDIFNGTDNVSVVYKWAG